MAITPTDDMGVSLPSPDLSSHVPILDFDEARKIYTNHDPPFVLKGSALDRPSRQVYLAENGKRPQNMISALVTTQTWSKNRYFLTLDSKDCRIIVKCRPNNGVVEAAKWSYFRWSASLDDFEVLPIAFSTINNNPDNISDFIKTMRKKKARKVQTHESPTSHVADPNRASRVPVDETDEIGADSSDDGCIMNHRLRSDPLSGDWFHLGLGSDVLPIGAHTSGEEANFSDSQNSSSSSDDGSPMKTVVKRSKRFTLAKKAPSRQLLPTRYASIIVPEKSSLILPRVHDMQEDSDSEGDNSDEIGIDTTTAPYRHNRDTAGPRSLIVKMQLPSGWTRNLSLKNSPKEAQGHGVGLESVTSARSRILGPSSASTEEIPLSCSRPRRHHNPPLRYTDSPLPVAGARKRKSEEDSSRQFNKKPQLLTPTMSPNFRQAGNASQLPEPRLHPILNSPPPPPPSTTHLEPSAPVLNAYKQAHTNLRVSINSPTVIGIVPLKLRSCMTIDAFFNSIMAATQTPRVSSATAIFDWKHAADPMKIVCVRKDLPDSFEVFLETVDEAACWTEEGGRCEIAVRAVGERV